MSQALYPLSFEPIFQYRLWGGRRLGDWMDTALPDGPIGEAWILSDRDDHPSKVTAGPLAGKTITELMTADKVAVLGDLAGRFERFPLLLKFLDVKEMLSVQVHPQDDKAHLIPKGESGKTESWVVLEADPKCRIYAGLKSHTTAQELRDLTTQTADDHLASFKPQIGQAVLITAGTVHSLGDGVMVFEVQENSDVTFRLYDWDHVDAQTGKKRDLQVEEALQCVDFDQGEIKPVTPVLEARSPAKLERLIDNAHFRMERLTSAEPFPVGVADAPRVLVCVQGEGCVQYDGGDYPMHRGAVILLPAAIGSCQFRPLGPATLLQIAVPEQA